MAAKLDKTQPFGDIFGDSEGRRYVQDGVYFDANEEPIGALTATKGKAKASKTAPETPAGDNQVGQVDAQLGAALG